MRSRILMYLGSRGNTKGVWRDASIVVKIAVDVTTRELALDVGFTSCAIYFHHNKKGNKKFLIIFAIYALPDIFQKAQN